jgi:hypothetical protein
VNDDIIITLLDNVTIKSRGGEEFRTPWHKCPKGVAPPLLHFLTNEAWTGSHVEFRMEATADEVLARQVGDSTVAVGNVGVTYQVLGDDVGPLIRLVGRVRLPTHMTLSADVRVRLTLNAGTR